MLRLSVKILLGSDYYETVHISYKSSNLFFKLCYNTTFYFNIQWKRFPNVESLYVSITIRLHNMNDCAITTVWRQCFVFAFWTARVKHKFNIILIARLDTNLSFVCINWKKKLNLQMWQIINWYQQCTSSTCLLNERISDRCFCVNSSLIKYRAEILLQLNYVMLCCFFSYWGY